MSNPDYLKLADFLSQHDGHEIYDVAEVQEAFDLMQLPSKVRFTGVDALTMQASIEEGPPGGSLSSSGLDKLLISGFEMAEQIVRQVLGRTILNKSGRIIMGRGSRFDRAVEMLRE